MKLFIMRIMYKLGLYETVKHFHQYTPGYQELKEALKQKAKETKGISIKDLEREDD